MKPIMTLEEDLKVFSALLIEFFHNKFDMVFEECIKHSDSLMYHALGACYHSFTYAIFTMEKDQIEKATKCCEDALKVIMPLRKQQSLVAGWFSKTDYNDFTDSE
ncbi:hypothetical protein HDE_04865 [Halotydeus destructor]|nr:hypothetical protein HDE_04865 [Halotydeus destructor]